MSSENIKRILDLESKIKYHDYLYHQQDTSVISDSEYDDLVREYHDLLAETPEYKPAIRVGFVEVDPTMTLVEIVEPMISISKKKNKEDFQKWIKNNVSTNAVYEDKLDGLALRLIYINGELLTGHNRGSGSAGGDVGHRLHLISNIPQTLPQYENEYRVEFTGEVFCMFDDFDNWLERHSLSKDDNDTRSAVSGLMRRLKPGPREDLPMYFKVYNASAVVREEFDTYTELRDHMVEIGFDVPFQLELNEVEEMLNMTSKPVGKYPIDGIVAKDNDLRKWEKEQTGEYYTYATCFKFPTLSFETTVTGIDWSLTNEGDLIGTLMYEPVPYDGTKMTRCKLDYAPSYFAKGLAIGSTISVTKGNEIIPKLVGLVKPGMGKKLGYPDKCPFCDKLVEIGNNSVARCVNEACEGQLVKQLTRLVEKSGLNIKGLGTERVGDLVDHGFLSEPADIFKLKEQDLITAGINSADATSILEQINKANDRDIMHWLFALAIPGLGLVRAADISNLAATNGLNDGLKFTSIKDLMLILSDSKFMSDQFGLDGLMMVTHIKKHENDISEFLSYYDMTKDHGKKEIGIPVAVTGSWPALTRELMEEGLGIAGFTLTNSVTKSTKCLLVGDKPSPTKTEKAKRYSVPLVPISSVHSLESIVALINNVQR